MRRRRRPPLGDRGGSRRRRFRLADVDCDSTPEVRRREDEGPGGAGRARGRAGRLAEKLHAESKGGRRSVLLVVQGWTPPARADRATSSARSTPRGPGDRVQGLTEEERKHDFLWRIRKALPGREDRVFDRSHYEDVLVVGATTLVPKSEWLKRYSQINSFEREVIVGHPDRQGDDAHLEGRAEGQAAQTARAAGQAPTSTTPATSGGCTGTSTWRRTRSRSPGRRPRRTPWYVVPAQQEVVRAVRRAAAAARRVPEMAPTWPVMDFDVAAELARLDAS